MITVTEGLALPEEELRFTASRSGGPGGQNVNKVSSRVTLLLDVTGSPTLSGEQKRLIQERLATRVSNAGVLRVTAQSSRSQAANRELATERLVELLRWALAEPEERRPTKIPRAARRRRRESKQRRSRVKRERATRFSADD